MPVFSEDESESESESEDESESESESESEDEDEDEEYAEAEKLIEECVNQLNEKIDYVFGNKRSLTKEINQMEHQIKQDNQVPELMVQYARAKLEMAKIIKHGEVLLRGLKACHSSLETQVAAEDQKVAAWRAKVDAQWPSASALCPVPA